MPNQFRYGRRFRILAVIDDFSREYLAAVVDASLPRMRIVRESDSFVALFGWPVNAKRVRASGGGLKVPRPQPKRGRLWLSQGPAFGLDFADLSFTEPMTSCRTGRMIGGGSDPGCPAPPTPPFGRARRPSYDARQVSHQVWITDRGRVIPSLGSQAFQTLRKRGI